MASTPLTFRNEPTPIDIGEGDKKKTITISDLPYREHQKLLTLIGEMWVEIAAVPQAVNRLDLEIQRRMMKEDKTAQDAAQMLQAALTGLYMLINDKRIVEILEIGAQGQIGDAELDIMTGTEAAGLAKFIIERNMKALKNFFASLTNIQSQPGEAKEK